MKCKAIYKVMASILLTVSAQWSFAGGVDTGGGNGLGAGKIYPVEIKAILKKVKEPSTYILRRIEFISGISNGFGLYPDLTRKLFQEKKTIYQALSEADIQPRMGPCYDRAGNEVDASAKDAPILCFSLTRLSERLNKDSAEGEILALFIHELSHMVEIDDPAFVLQTIVKTSLVNEPLKKIPSLVKKYRSDLKDVIESVDYLITQLSQIQNQEICSGLSALMPMTNNLLQKNMNNMMDENQTGISFLAPLELATLQGVLLRSINALPFCLIANPEYQKITQAFKGQSEITIAEYQTRLYPEAKMDLVPKGIIRRVQAGDTKVLRQEISDMKSSLLEIDSSL